MSASEVPSLRWRLLAVLVLYLAVVALTLAALAALYLVGVPLAVDLTAQAFEIHTAAGTFFVVGIVLVVLATGQRIYSEVTETPLERVEADPVYERAYGDLLERLDDLASTAGIPTPDLHQVDSDVPAAFTAGIRQSSATIVVTTALLQEYDLEVLAAVLAHEVAHIAHRDGGLMYAAQVFPAIAYAIANAVYRPLFGDGGPEPDSTATPREAARGTAGRSAEMGSDDSASGLQNARLISDPRAIPAAIVLIGVAIATVLLTGLIALVAWLASAAIYRLLSRTREYAADERAAELLDDPAAVARMLEALDRGVDEAPDDDLLALDGGHEPLYVLGIDRSLFEDDPGRLLADDIFPTSHPPIEERIARLEQSARGGR